MREFILPKWGWYIQHAAVAGALFDGCFMLYGAIVGHTFELYIFAAGCLIISAFILHLLWFRWPLRITIDDNNMVSFITKGNIVKLALTDIHTVRFGRGVWLYHAQGKYAFSAAPTNAVLWEFLRTLKERNPNFIIRSSYISAMVSRVRYSYPKEDIL